MHELNPTHPLCRLFRGLTEHAFMAELGIADPSLVEYVAGLLARFVPSEHGALIRDARGDRLQEVTAMIAAANAADDAGRRKDCYRHVGDFTLFWTGVYPEAIAKLKQRDTGCDRLLDFQEQGKRSYYLASTLAGDDEKVLRTLSAEFELCAFGLSRVRKEWEALPTLPHDGRLLVA